MNKHSSGSVVLITLLFLTAFLSIAISMWRATIYLYTLTANQQCGLQEELLLQGLFSYAHAMVQRSYPILNSYTERRVRFKNYFPSCGYEGTIEMSKDSNQQVVSYTISLVLDRACVTTKQGSIRYDPLYYIRKDV